MYHIKYGKYIFYCIVALIFGLVLLSQPFLRYPYDMFAHLIAIDEMYHGLTYTSTSIQHSRLLWHSIWAAIFHIFHIDSIDILLRAKIIHIVQTIIAFIAVYYFSHVLIRNLFKNISWLTVAYLSLWSVIIWFSIYATYSVAYHQVWNMWYSVNYQITLPLFWYMLGLTLALFLEKISQLKKVWFTIQILGIGVFILQVHAMEFMYYLMHFGVLVLVFIDKICKFLKKYYLYLFPFVGGIVYGIISVIPEKSKIFTYFTVEKFPYLYAEIMANGRNLLGGYNRSIAVMNELIYTLLLLIIIVSLYVLWKYYIKKPIQISVRLWIFLVITSLFVTIPLFEFSSGLFAIVTRWNIVHRIYFSAPLFVILPVFSYLLFRKYRLLYINIIIGIFLILIYIFSKNTDIYYHNYYKNVQSIKDSFDREKVGFHLHNNNIEWIGKQLKSYEEIYKTKKPLYYYARADVAFVIKYIYRRNVYWLGRRRWIEYKKQYKEHKLEKKYYPVLFKLPDDFVPYKPYM